MESVNELKCCRDKDNYSPRKKYYKRREINCFGIARINGDENSKKYNRSLNKSKENIMEKDVKLKKVASQNDFKIDYVKKSHGRNRRQEGYFNNNIRIVDPFPLISLIQQREKIKINSKMLQKISRGTSCP